MREDFVRKKVESLTLGEKMRKLRSQYRMSLAEVSRATKIQVKYLEALESGEYGKLPAEVYVRGFLTSYARHLGVDEQIFLRLYDKERHIRVNLGQDTDPDTRPRLPLSSSVVITPRMFTIAVAVLLLALTFTYLFREFRSFVAEPQLVLLEPLSGAVIEGSSTVVRGHTERGATVMLNGVPVVVGTGGEFEEAIALQPGTNTVVVTATNRFEKQASETIAFEAHFPETTATPERVPQPEMQLSLTGREQGAFVTVSADGMVVWNGKIAAGENQRMVARNEFTVTANPGRGVEASLDGGESELVSQKPGLAEGVRFTRSGRVEP